MISAFLVLDGQVIFVDVGFCLVVNFLHVCFRPCQYRNTEWPRGIDFVPNLIA